MSNPTPIFNAQYTMHKVISTIGQRIGLSSYRLNLFISLSSIRANNRGLSKNEILKHYAKTFDLTYSVVYEHTRALEAANYVNKDLSLGYEGVRLKAQIKALYRLEYTRD